MRALASQVDGIVVVDDGSGPTAAAPLDRARELGAHVIALPDNVGIAAALNAGIRHALDSGADAAATFDQDSHVGPDFVARLVELHDDLHSDGITPGPIVPQFFADVSQAARADSQGRLLAENSIQSGMLISRALIERVGMFREDFFIDLVDTEYELRCIDSGVPVRAVSGLRLGHRLGARYRRRGRLPLPIPRIVTLSSPFRYYYRMRNRILLERGYRRRFPLRLLRDGLTDRLHFMIVISLARPRRDMWAIVRAGARAGRRSVGGRAPDEILRRAQRVQWAADRLADD
ncbi:glycosyltransferase [Microbacterium yannicii]|nr:glycosyltransferase [Microbacterium yannicii]